jgi:hypothetical protein
LLWREEHFYDDLHDTCGVPPGKRGGVGGRFIPSGFSFEAMLKKVLIHPTTPEKIPWLGRSEGLVAHYPMRMLCEELQYEMQRRDYLICRVGLKKKSGEEQTADLRYMRVSAMTAPGEVTLVLI